MMMRVATAAAVVAVLFVLGAALGARAGAWRWSVGFGVMAVGILLAAFAIILALVAAWRTGQWSGAAVSIVVALVAVGVPAAQVLSARGAPPIHDITTDVNDPPRFRAVVPLRTGDVSPAEYDGPEAAAQQQRAYPDIQPILLNVPVARALDQAAAAARDLGWTVVAVDRGTATVEATDTTRWFHFTDDVAIRVRESAAGSRVDIRSKSRVGRGDLGANARRIRAFAAKMRG
jgi:uncharacterized protein (DUF1499 family)